MELIQADRCSMELYRGIFRTQYIKYPALFCKYDTGFHPTTQTAHLRLTHRIVTGQFEIKDKSVRFSKLRPQRFINQLFNKYSTNISPLCYFFPNSYVTSTATQLYSFI